jgi:hypothetical protein
MPPVGSAIPMRRTRLLAAVLAGALAAASAPAAQAAWFAGEPIDGPGPDVLSVGDVDLARDGTGALAYLKREGGVPHVFVSRMLDGAWQAPERADPGLAGAASAVTVAAGDSRRLAVAFVSDGALYGTFTPGGGQTAPFAPPQPLAAGSPAVPVTDPHADLGINGTAYVAFTAAGDVRAVRLQDAAWEAVPAALDVDPAQLAGQGAGRPRIAVSAEGNAVATWAEDAPDGRRRVYGRRVTGLVPSSAPQEISLADLGGVPGGAADSPDLDVEDDGSFAWVVWRQDFGGSTRAIARRLVGSLFEAPVAIDGGQPAEAPRFEMNGRGVGVSVAQGAGGTVAGGLIDLTDAFTAFPRLDAGGQASAPVVAIAERRQTAVAWAKAGGVEARFKPDEKSFEAITGVAAPELGVVSGSPQISGSGRGDFAVAFMQGAPDAARIVAAVYDRPPGAPAGRSSTSYQRRSRPRLAWGAGADLWGAQRFNVVIDGAPVGVADRSPFQVPAPLADGRHRWRVEAVDRRGQVTRMRDRLLRIDATPPRATLRVRGRRARNRTLDFRVSVRDGRGGSGVRTVSVDYGDRTPKSTRPSSKHRYRRRGTFTVRVRVTDRARNAATTTTRLRITAR